MQYGTPACHARPPHEGETRGISTHTAHTVAPSEQWINTTNGRIATCPHSWMQAVHWTIGNLDYTPSRNHGPRKMNDTTLRIAQEVAALKECRPGIAYLMRKLNASERTVQYHLDMLRETGLLTYRTRGGRATSSVRRASEFDRTIPAVFDTALGIRTTGEGVQRRPVGIADEHRSTIGKLAKKAARKVRRKPSRKPGRNTPRCTPMQGGTSGSSSDGGTHSPSESKLASGPGKSPTPKKPNRGRRRLNKVGRRHQLGSELIRQVPWLHRANPDRIAWIVREVADAGWTADEVIAYLDTTTAPQHAMRPSGLLAYRLKGVTDLPGWTTPEKRAQGVQEWRDSRRAAAARHVEWDGDWQAPQSRAVRRMVADAMDQVREANTSAAADLLEIDTPRMRIEDLTRDEVIDMRAEAQKNPDLIRMAIDMIGERDARRLYTNHLVDRARRGTSSYMRLHAWQGSYA